MGTANDAVAAFVAAVAGGALAGWSFVPVDRAAGAEPDLRQPRPIVDTDGRILGVVRFDEPSDELGRMAAAWFETVLLLVATERRRRATAARATRAEEASRVDGLTGLPNRRSWDETLAVEEARAERTMSQLAIAVVDLDGLKHANDSGGHRAGDALLRTTAATLRACTRSTDTVARLGGDEFAVLAVDWEDEEAATLAERLRAALAAVGVAASVGSAVHRRDTFIEHTFDRADAAMYDAKRRRPAAVVVGTGNH